MGLIAKVIVLSGAFLLMIVMVVADYVCRYRKDLL